MVDSINIATIANKPAPMWATEDTLGRVRELIQTGVQLDKSGQQWQKGPKVKGDDQRIKGLGKDFDKTMEKNRTILSQTLSKTIKGVIVGGASYETMFKKGAQSIGEWVADMSSRIPIFGILLLPVIVGLKNLAEVVQIAVAGMVDLYDAGISLNGSFINLMRVAGQSNIGLIELIEAVKNHSASITRMSTESNKGIAAFGELSLAVRENIKDFDYFGLSIAETNEILGEYLDTQMVAGQLQKLDRARTAEAVGGYIKELTRLSLFTGKRRKQVQAEVEEVARKTSIAAVLAGMSDSAALEMKKMLALSASYGPTAVQMVEEMILTGTTGLSEGTAGAAALMPGFVKNFGAMIQSIKDGQIVSEETRARMVQQANLEGKQLAEVHGKNLGFIATQNEAIAGGLTIALAARQLTKDNYQQQLEFKDAISKFYISWDHIKQEFFSRFMEIATTFLKILNDSGIIEGLFGRLKEGLETFTGWLSDNVTEEKMSAGFNRFLKWIDDFSVTNPFAGIGEMFEATGIKEMFTSFIDGMLSRFEYGIERLINKLTPLGVAGTSKSYNEWITGQEEFTKREEQRQKDLSEPFDPLFLKYFRGEGGFFKAKGGIARVPSMFGEAGPEVAIPLTTGERIPVAEVRRPAKEMKTFEDIRSLLEDIKDRVEFQAQEIQTQTGIQRQIERKAGSDSSRIF